jgi:lipoprotein-releasing system ATP-binding protein
MTDLPLKSPFVLEAKKLKKSFATPHREKIHVIDGIDLSLNAGESLSIRGESGAGKTTLLNLITLLENPDSGEVLWEGKTVSKYKHFNLAKQRGNFFGLIFQSHYLIPELNALENVLMAKRLIGPLELEDKERARELLNVVGLKNRMTHLSNQLSGGEAQRVSIARALMNNPRVIVADEPTGNLDEKTGLGVMELLLSLCSEVQTSLILVTHNPDFAEQTQRQGFLTFGKLEIK